MKKAIACTAMLLALNGCAEPGAPAAPGVPANPKVEDPHGKVSVFEVDVRGKKVTCVGWDIIKGGGLYCDWANAK
jgi:hypothetical protein